MLISTPDGNTEEVENHPSASLALELIVIFFFQQVLTAERARKRLSCEKTLK